MNELDLYNYKDLFAVTWLACVVGSGFTGTCNGPCGGIMEGKKGVFEVLDGFFNANTGSTWELNPHSEVR